MRIAVAQFRASEDPWENLATIQALSESATLEGARLICFPENSIYRGRRSKMTRDVVLRRLENGKLDATTSSFARELRDFQATTKIAVSLGSVVEESADPLRPYNSHWILRPGDEIGAYQKIHLFTFHQGEVIYRESDQVSRGETPVIFEFEGVKFGLSICYDLRFPELYRSLVLDHGSQVLLVPAAFTIETGRAHWHSLLRARAIENLSYVVASAQWGSHFNELDQRLWCYGHSLAYDPWGEPLGEAPEQGDSLFYIDIDLERVRKVRERLPSLEDIELW